MGSDAAPEPDVGLFRRPVRARTDFRLEFRFISTGNALVLQPVCMAIVIRIRGVVRRRRRGQNLVHHPVSCSAGDLRCMGSLRTPDRDDLAQRFP